MSTFHISHGDEPLLGRADPLLYNVIYCSRATKGVTIFSTAKDEKVVSVERINEPEGDEEAENGNGEDVASGANLSRPCVHQFDRMPAPVARLKTG